MKRIAKLVLSMSLSWQMQMYETVQGLLYKIKIKHLPFHSELGEKQESAICWSSQVTWNTRFRAEDLFSPRSVLKNTYLKNACSLCKSNGTVAVKLVKLVPYLGGILMILSGKLNYVNVVI